MFAKMIIDSDAFLDMPLSTQALYFHLNMRADDEGFVNKPKMIMRMIGASQNELELLLAKRYLLLFDSGVVVIKHWRIHNYIQKDRFKSTLYQEERDMLGIKENKSYTEVDNLDTKCVQNGDTGKVRLELGKSKVRVNKDIYTPESDLKFFNDEDFQEAWVDWMSVRAKKKASKSDRTIKRIIINLKDWSGNDKKACIAILDKSSGAGYSDIYQPKEQTKTSPFDMGGINFEIEESK